MQYADQVQQAVQFCEAHQEEIVQLRADLQQAGTWLISRAFANFPDIPQLSSALRSCELGDISNAFRLIRPSHEPFYQLGLTSLFWEWIDAVNFLHDATGSRWPHMNQDGRLRCLEWALEGAQVSSYRVPLVSALTTEQPVSVLTTTVG